METTGAVIAPQVYDIDADRRVFDAGLEALFGAGVVASDAYNLRTYSRYSDSIVRAGGRMLVATCRLKDGRRERIELNGSGETMPDIHPSVVKSMMRIANSQPVRERYAPLL